MHMYQKLNNNIPIVNVPPKYPFIERLRITEALGQPLALMNHKHFTISFVFLQGLMPKN